MDGRKDFKWKVLKSKSGRSKRKKMYDLNKGIWTVSRGKNRQSKGMKLDGVNLVCNWTVHFDNLGPSSVKLSVRPRISKGRPLLVE